MSNNLYNPTGLQKHLDWTDCMFKDPRENQYSALRAQSSAFCGLGEHCMSPCATGAMGLASNPQPTQDKKKSLGS